MTRSLAVRKKKPDGDTRVSVLEKVDPNKRKGYTRFTSDKREEVIIKGDLVILKTKQTKVAETIDVLNQDSQAFKDAWKKWHEIQDEIETIEQEVAV